MSEGLGEVTFADADFTDDENRSALGKIAPGGEIVHQGTIERKRVAVAHGRRQERW
jgi:hypothetical protein